MNPSQDFSSEAQNPANLSSGPGRRLRELRESRGIEIERVIAQLHLQRDILEALEQDRYQDLPPPVFVAGYLKSYARLLSTDPTPIVEAYRSTLPSDEHLATQAKTQPRSRKSSNALIWTILLALIGGAAAGGYFWWQDQGTPAPEATEPMADTSAPNGDTDDDSASATATNAVAESDQEEPSDPAAARVPPDAIPLRSQNPPPPSEPAVSQQPIEQTPDSTPPEEPAGEPEEPAGPPEVALEFTGTTWIDVRDAQGKVVLNGEMHEDERHVLTGEPPYKLVIGNAAATRMTVGGKEFDLQARARGNVARFSLDPESI